MCRRAVCGDSCRGIEAAVIIDGFCAAEGEREAADGRDGCGCERRGARFVSFPSGGCGAEPKVVSCTDFCGKWGESCTPLKADIVAAALIGVDAVGRLCCRLEND